MVIVQESYFDSFQIQDKITNIQPIPECTHCRNHAINLPIAHACKNSSIQRFMTSLTEATHFLEASPKVQQYFEHFVEFYKKQLGMTESKIKILKELSKTQWVGCYQAYDILYLLQRFLTFFFFFFCFQFKF